MTYDIKNDKLYYMNSEHTFISCEWNHPDFGIIPFAAHKDDVVEHGREIYEELNSGVHGNVVSYEDSHYWSTIDNNEFNGNTYNIGKLIISPKGIQPPNSTKVPPPGAFDNPFSHFG